MVMKKIAPISKGMLSPMDYSMCQALTFVHCVFVITISQNGARLFIVIIRPLKGAQNSHQVKDAVNLNASMTQMSGTNLQEHFLQVIEKVHRLCYAY